MIDNVMEFLKRPVIQLDGLKITVAVLIIAAVVFMAYKRAKGR